MSKQTKSYLTVAKQQLQFTDIIVFLSSSCLSNNHTIIYKHKGTNTENERWIKCVYIKFCVCVGTERTITKSLEIRTKKGDRLWAKPQQWGRIWTPPISCCIRLIIMRGGGWEDLSVFLRFSGFLRITVAQMETVSVPACSPQQNTPSNPCWGVCCLPLYVIKPHYSGMLVFRGSTKGHLHFLYIKQHEVINNMAEVRVMLFIPLFLSPHLKSFHWIIVSFTLLETGIKSANNNTAVILKSPIQKPELLQTQNGSQSQLCLSSLIKTQNMWVTYETEQKTEKSVLTDPGLHEDISLWVRLYYSFQADVAVWFGNPNACSFQDVSVSIRTKGWDSTKRTS